MIVCYGFVHYHTTKSYISHVTLKVSHGNLLAFHIITMKRLPYVLHASHSLTCEMNPIPV